MEATNIKTNACRIGSPNPIYLLYRALLQSLKGNKIYSIITTNKSRLCPFKGAFTNVVLLSPPNTDMYFHHGADKEAGYNGHFYMKPTAPPLQRKPAARGAASVAAAPPARGSRGGCWCTSSWATSS